MDIRVFMDISLQLSMLLWISIWISMDIHALTCYGFSIQGYHQVGIKISPFTIFQKIYFKN